jgi:NADH:ubiquinone oxidoreductase subunit 3 (subunit A)
MTPIIAIVLPFGVSLKTVGPISLVTMLIFEVVGVIMIISAVKIKKEQQIPFSSKLSSI